MATTKTCKNCNQEFNIDEWDISFYKKISVPSPNFCPQCREQLRLLHVNHINLFKRKCDGTGKEIISNIPEGSPYKVYSQEYWYSDKYDDTEPGREYDFTKPFFEQYAKLSKEAPRPALFTNYLLDNNSEYTNCAGKNKDCYLIFDSDENWDCIYSYGMNSSKNSLDCLRVQKLELCYEAVDSKNCYNCEYIYNSENCSDSMFMHGCIGCKNCLFCCNLRQKEYYIANKQVTKDSYEQIKNNFKSHKYLLQKIKEFKEFKLQFPQKYMIGFQNENCTGNYLVHCKNAINCFDSVNLWDAKYCHRTFMHGKDFMDATECGESELIYDSNVIAYNGYNIKFSLQCANQMSNLTYCSHCFRCSDLFGCIGLKKKKHCILNKQYSEEEYTELVPKIINHMTETGEWGQFLPHTLSLFGYNITLAQQYFPLTKEQALAKGYYWQDEDKKEYKPQTFQIPDSITDVQEKIIDEILACETCGKNFKLNPKELKFYKQKNISIPRNCFNCRHLARFELRNPSQLYMRKCQKCGEDIETTYSPERKEIVYCEKCYLEALD